MPRAGKKPEIPTQTHNFVGRDEELDQIIELLLTESVRLTTLLGLGGIGKTSLAAEALRRFREKHKGTSVSWVWLARLERGSAREDVVRVTASAAVDADFSGREPWDALVATLKRRASKGRTILVLDNCEHVVDGAAEMVDDLLHEIPGLTVMATSRALLGWAHERVVHVRPMTVEDASKLFEERAALTDHPVIDDEQQEIVAEICQHIDWNPLSIEMAASWLERQPLAVVRDALSGKLGEDKRLAWSAGARVGTEKRHTSFAAVIESSYGLLTPKEQYLFERMSVFAVGYDANPGDASCRVAEVGADLDAIKAVCSDRAATPGDAGATLTLSEDEIEDLIDGLARQSMITRHFSTTEVRFSVPESLRLFGWEQLRQRSSGDVDETARLAEQHMLYYRDEVIKAAAQWFSPDERRVVDWARVAWDNLFVAVETSLRQPDQAAAGLAICHGLLELRLWLVRDSVRAMQDWTERCLAATESLSPQPFELQVAARADLCWYLVRKGDKDEAERRLIVLIGDCIPDPDRRAAWLAHPELDMPDRLEGLPDRVDRAWGTWLFMARRDPVAVMVLKRARGKFTVQGDNGGAMMAGMFAGMAAALFGSSEDAFEIAEQCLTNATVSRADWAQSYAELPWAITHTIHGDARRAVQVLHHALTYMLSIGDQWAATWAVVLDTWARAALGAAAGSDREKINIAIDIAYRMGGIETHQERLGVDPGAMGMFADQSRKTVTWARSVLGTARYAEAVAIGRSMDSEKNQVHLFVLGSFVVARPRWAQRPADPVPGDSDASRPWHNLTPLMQDIAILVAAGFTSRQVAARKGKSKRTVDNQVSEAMRRLGINSRKAIRQNVPGHVAQRIVEAEKDLATLAGQD